MFLPSCVHIIAWQFSQLQSWWIIFNGAPAIEMPCTHWSLRLCRGIKGAWQHSFLGGYRCKNTHSQTSKNTHLFSQWGLRTQLPLCDEWKKDAQQGKGRWKNDRWEERGGKWCMSSCDVFNLEYGIISVKGGRPVYECMLQEWNNESGGMWQKEGTVD